MNFTSVNFITVVLLQIQTQWRKIQEEGLKHQERNSFLVQAQV